MFASLDLTEALRDLQALDALRTGSLRACLLLCCVNWVRWKRDVMNDALDGSALFKVLGKGTGLEALQKEVGARFAKRRNDLAQRPVASQLSCTP